MDKDAMGGPFPRGGANTAYARYFVGDSYLNMLSTEGVVIGNVTFEPGCEEIYKAALHRSILVYHQYKALAC